MNKFRRVPLELKEQILQRIRMEGISVSQASKEHHVSTPTIYSWLTAIASVHPNILQINKLKKENEELQRLLGKAMMEIERSKKNNARYGIQ